MENGMAAISMGRWVLVDIKVLVKPDILHVSDELDSH